jgi:hypothetical protein
MMYEDFPLATEHALAEPMDEQLRLMEEKSFGVWCRILLSTVHSLRVALLALEKDAKRWETLCSLLDGSGIFEIPFNANDTFGYACADCVSAETRSELTSAIDAYQVAQWGGVMAWMETKSNARVIKEHREATDAGHAALAASEKEKR